MPRPKKYRKVKCSPTAYYFKPRAISLASLQETVLEADELESLHLADFRAFSHEKSARQMKISRATFGRIVEKARFKLADAILNGKAIKISDELPVPLRNKSTECAKCKSCSPKGVKLKNGICVNCKKLNERSSK